MDYSTILYPDDKTVLNKLNKIPGFKNFLRNTVSAVREAYNEVEYAGNGVDVNRKSMPKVYSILVDTARRLGMSSVPACSTDWYYGISSFTVGDDCPRIVLQTGTIELLTESELIFVLGHEMGHILCGHMPYHMLLEAIYGQSYGETLEFKAMSALVKMPLMEWYRNSDFSADRVGLLACQDINAALRAMIKMAGLPKNCYDEINVSAFLKQAYDFESELSEGLDKIAKRAYIRTCDFPCMVHRAAKLMEWYNSEKYQKLIH